MQEEMPTAKPDQLQEFQHGDEIACYGAPVTEQIGWKKFEDDTTRRVWNHGLEVLAASNRRPTNHIGQEPE